MAWCLRLSGALALVVETMASAACGAGSPPDAADDATATSESSSSTDAPGSVSSATEGLDDSTTNGGTIGTTDASSDASSDGSSGDASTGEDPAHWTPSLFVTRMQTGQDVPTLYVDPFTVEILGSDFEPSAVSLIGGAFFPDAETMVVASRPLAEIHVVHLAGDTPEWTLASSIGPLGEGVGLDPERNLLWVVRAEDGPDDLLAIDVDELSPTFGEVAAEIDGVGTLDTGQPWAYSPARAELAFPVFGTDDLTLLNADPDAVGFGEVIDTLAIPSTGGFSWAMATTYVPDGSALWLGLFMTGAGGNELARYDFASAAFVDHDPAVAGTQNIGPAAADPVELDGGIMGIAVDDHAALAIVHSGDDVLALAIDDASVVAQPLEGAPGGHHEVCLVQAEETLLVAVGTDPPELHVWRADDLSPVGDVSIGSGGAPTLVCPAHLEMEGGR